MSRRYPTFRPGVIYGVRTRHPRWTWWVRTRYVGLTRQRPWTRRIAQHAEGQPWGDLIVDSYVIYESRQVSDWGLRLREWFHILVRLPSYNVVHNRRNPFRVARSTAERQRSLRDAGGRRPIRLVVGLARLVAGVALLALGLVVLVAGLAYI